MKLGYFLEDAELGKVAIYPNDKVAEIFTLKDMDYLEGKTRKRPLDLDLHIAIYILRREGLQRDILGEVEQWVRENPVARTQLTKMFCVAEEK